MKQNYVINDRNGVKWLSIPELDKIDFIRHSFIIKQKDSGVETNGALKEIAAKILNLENNQRKLKKHFQKFFRSILKKCMRIFRKLPADTEDLGAGARQGVFEPRDLVGDLLGADRTLRKIKGFTAMQDEYLPDRNARRNTDPLICLH